MFETKILRGGNSAEPFLTSSIPNLKLDPLTINVHSSDLEVHADSREVVDWKNVVSESNQESTLSNAWNNQRTESSLSKWSIPIPHFPSYKQNNTVKY